MKVSEGMRGRVMLVWQNIDSPFFTDEEKGEAIRHVLDLATHNGIKKAEILNVSIFGIKFLRWRNESGFIDSIIANHSKSYSKATISARRVCEK